MGHFFQLGTWTEQGPGWLEMDTVALCGGALDDKHLWMPYSLRRQYELRPHFFGADPAKLRSPPHRVGHVDSSCLNRDCCASHLLEGQGEGAVRLYVKDAQAETIPGNPEAARLLSRDYRSPWVHPQGCIPSKSAPPASIGYRRTPSYTKP